MEGIPIPPIPTRTRNADSSKRHTFALDAGRPQTAKSVRSNRVTLQPASTEVISSLISSLSAISTPAEDLFDKLLPAPPTTPGAPPPTAAHPRRDESLSLAGTSIPDQATYLRPDDAAVPPVVGTAKPPSGFSPLTAPKRASSSGFNLSSSKSSPNLKGQPVLRSIGNLSIEPAARYSSDHMSLRSDGSKGSRSSKDLRVKSSKEKIRDLDKERKKKKERMTQKDVGKRSELPHRINIEPPARSPLKRSFSEDVAPKASTPTSPTFPVPTNFLDGSSPDSSARPGGIGSGRIPTRESSLRHSQTPNRVKSRKSYGANHVPREIHVEDPNEEGGPSLPSSTSKPQTEDQVRRRIDELKSMKEKRERAQSEDEKPAAARRSHERRSSNKGRSSLPAPSAPSENGENMKRRRGSDPPQKRPARPISPPLEANSKQPHSPRNSLGQGRISSSVVRDERPSTADSIDEAVVDYLTAPRLSQKIYHPQTGRAISFSEVGDPDGSVVFCCVGMGTTRFITAFYDELAATLGLRLITLDRPGIGDSEPYRNGPETPLAWPDDLRAVCSHLHISRFSLLAHSAGAIYALATALRMPQHIRGRIHLLAPWIPPSQMVAIGLNAAPAPVNSLPMSQRFLRSLPTPFLRAANSSFFSMTSTSITTSIQRSPRRSKQRRSFGPADAETSPAKARAALALDTDVVPNGASGPGILTPDSDFEGVLGSSLIAATSADAAAAAEAAAEEADRERRGEYDGRLTQAIWTAATANANPAVDLLVCLERVHDIGFRYVDVRKEVVVHHGDRDSRVPIGNVRWLAGMMRAAELRVLEGEGHGLMANPIVMGDVLSEMAQDWEDWLAVTGGNRRR